MNPDLVQLLREYFLDNSEGTRSVLADFFHDEDLGDLAEFVRNSGIWEIRIYTRNNTINFSVRGDVESRVREYIKNHALTQGGSFLSDWQTPITIIAHEQGFDHETGRLWRKYKGPPPDPNRRVWVFEIEQDLQDFLNS